MNEPLLAPASGEAADLGATLLASHIAAKLCHDFISPTGAIVSGLDLLKDPSAQDMRDDAMSLIEASAHKLVSIVNFARVAFGAATSAERFDVRELEALVSGAFEHVRADLDWAVELQTFEKPAARAMLNLAQIGGGALPTGGVARVTGVREGDEIVLAVEARGARVRMKPEVATGLRGEQLTDGLAGQWIQPFWLWEVVRDAGGTLTFETSEEGVSLRVRMPA